MPRRAIFPTDTVLYSAQEPGGRLFPAGEQDPGPAWWDSPDGPPKAAEGMAGLVEDLTKAQDAIARLEAANARQVHDLAQMAKARDEANAKVAGFEADLNEARAAREASEAAAATLTQERDRARELATQLQDRIAKMDPDGDGVPGGSLKAAEDPDATEKAALRAELAALNQPDPHHKTGVVKLRELVAAAKA